MSFSDKVELKRAELGLVRSKLGEKIKSISVLFLVVETLLVLSFGALVRYEYIGVGEEKVIINVAKASEKYDSWETDCFNQIDRLESQYPDVSQKARRIVEAESGGNYKAENKTSTATSCFQFINGTWRRYGKELWGEEFYKKNIYNPEDNVSLGLYVLDKYGDSDWDASKHIWTK